MNFNSINGYFDDWDVRQALYWSVFSGACGVTYGHHSVWGMIKDGYSEEYFPEGYFPIAYPEALDRPGAFAVAYLVDLINSRDFLDCVPAQDILAGNYSGAPHIRALKNKNYAYIYSPCGLRIKIAKDKLGFEPDSFMYYNPRNGEYTETKAEPKPGNILQFTPPSSGRNNDWILIVDKR